MLKLENINKKLGAFSLSEVCIDIREGEYFVLLGRSGSGKTQLLELIAGLTNPDSGDIWIDNRKITGTKIQNRNVGLVFQDYAVFPNMTVYENIAYSLHSVKAKRSEIHERVTAIAGEFNISHLLNRSTIHLSGGELQRVALTRTLISHPRILLLDEPLASIDASLKDDIRRLLRKLHKKGLTIVHVTHDYREAVSLATRVGVIHNGRIIQTGTPDEVFSRPVNKFVARYSGIRNFYRVKLVRENGILKARCDGTGSFVIKESSYPAEGIMIIKSSDIKIHTSEPTGSFANCFKGIVKEIYPSEYGMEVMVDAGEIFYVDVPSDDYKLLQIKELSEVWITFPADAGIVLEGTG
ncbi:MAG TPA: ABC transporter ATP-binding protein [Bacteroidales bacterium]|nr:ABC transporter ATP-binding protein [Bacteroidales bacterium]